MVQKKNLSIRTVEHGQSSLRRRRQKESQTTAAATGKSKIAGPSQQIAPAKQR
jgi:hypothetical protein